jgi:hypothetical protein
MGDKIGKRLKALSEPMVATYQTSHMDDPPITSVLREHHSMAAPTLALAQMQNGSRVAFPHQREAGILDGGGPTEQEPYYSEAATLLLLGATRCGRLSCNLVLSKARSEQLAEANG